MRRHMDLGMLAKAALESVFTLSEIDLGDDGCLAKNGIVLETRAWDVSGFGHLCAMRMRAPLGLMRMETIVLAPAHVDAPLFNVDWACAFGKEMQIAELYDVQLRPWPQPYQAEFQRIKDRYANLSDAKGSDHWYDAILYPCSCRKQGGGKDASADFTAMAQDYVASYIAMLGVLPTCDAASKTERTRAFAKRLFEDGGVSTKLLTRLFGEEVTQRLMLIHMYGVEV